MFLRSSVPYPRFAPLSVRCRHHSVKSRGVVSGSNNWAHCYYVRCRHRSVNCEPRPGAVEQLQQGFLKIVRLFLYKERRQLWNITVNRYRNNMQVQFIRFRQKISPLFRLCFIQCNIAHSRCEAIDSKQNAFRTGHFEQSRTTRGREWVHV